ncbi:DUF397 domain-containing protein [Streptomyces luteireticuli]|uniref:DUF397 domain-containing protein n=1 Tax=Streptomyces luteireticuli TaxID=173858 RepID=A0ABP3J026_9ACTN
MGSETMFARIAWQKSSYSGGGDENSCVEVRGFCDGIAIRESDAPDVVITTNRSGLRALTKIIRSGAVDQPS